MTLACQPLVVDEVDLDAVMSDKGQGYGTQAPLEPQVSSARSSKSRKLVKGVQLPVASTQSDGITWSPVRKDVRSVK